MLSFSSVYFTLPLFALIYAVSFMVRRLQNSQLTFSRLPRGPWPLLFFGNPWYLHKLNTSPGPTCRHLARCYGDMATLWLGSLPIILINSPQVAHELLQKGAASTSSRPLHNDFRYQSLPSRVVLAPVGDDFRKLRKIYSSLMSIQQSGIFPLYQEAESLFLLGKLLEDPQSFLFECDRFAVNVLFRAIYNVRLDKDQDCLIKEMYKLWETVYRCFLPGSLIMDIFPCLLKLPPQMQPWIWLVENLKRGEAGLHTPYLQKAKSKMPNIKSDASQYQGFAVELLKEGTDDETIINILAMVLGAASDTTSSVLQLFFKVMALHPDATAMAQAEIDVVIGFGRLPSWADQEKLPYVRALIKELHRWAPIAIADGIGIGVPHATTEEVIYQNYTIPKGAILIPNIPALSRSPERYSDPDIFNPLRFLEDRLDPAASARNADHMSRDHFQFGFGRRFCPGSHVAEATLYIAIVRILWGFDIQALPGVSLGMEKQRDGLLKKPKAFVVKITPRGPAYERVIASTLGEVKVVGTSS